MFTFWDGELGRLSGGVAGICFLIWDIVVPLRGLWASPTLIFIINIIVIHAVSFPEGTLILSGDKYAFLRHACNVPSTRQQDNLLQGGGVGLSPLHLLIFPLSYQLRHSRKTSGGNWEPVDRLPQSRVGAFSQSHDPSDVFVYTGLSPSTRLII